MGMELEFAHDEGPQIHNPVRESADVDRVIELEDADALHFVMEAVRQTRADLPPQYSADRFCRRAVHAGQLRDRRRFEPQFSAHQDADVSRRRCLAELMGRFARSVIVYLNAQIAAGAQAVQLFDSWVGCLGPDDYRQYVLPYVAEVVRGITPGVPVINFATGNPQLLAAARRRRGDGRRRRLARAARRCVEDDRPRSRDPGKSRPDVTAGGSRANSAAARATFSTGRRPTRATSSTSATVSCRRPPSSNAKSLVDIVHEESARK